MKRIRSIPNIVARVILAICLLFVCVTAILLLIVHFSTETDAYLQYEASDIPLSWTDNESIRRTETTKSRYHFFSRDWYYAINRSTDAVIVQHKSLEGDTFSILYDHSKIQSPFEVYDTPEAARLSFEDDKQLVQSVSFLVDDPECLARFFRELCESKAVSKVDITSFEGYDGNSAAVFLSFYNLTFSLVKVNGERFWHLPAYDPNTCWLIPYHDADFGAFLDWYGRLPTKEGKSYDT